ncbi:hypothetical protein ACHWQZ_G005782 [Mnemiopsis leidyi]
MSEVNPKTTSSANENTDLDHQTEIREEPPHDLTTEQQNNPATKGQEKLGTIKVEDEGGIESTVINTEGTSMEKQENVGCAATSIENGEDEGITRTKSQHQLDVDVPIEGDADKSKEPDDSDKTTQEKAPHRTARLCRNATFITPPRVTNPPRRSAQDIDNQNAAISALISQQHNDLFEQTQRTKEIIAAVRRNIRNSIQNKRQEQLARQSKHLPAVRQNFKMTSVNLNDFSLDLPKQGPRILIPSKRRAKRWRIKLPPLDKYDIKKSDSMDFRS